MTAETSITDDLIKMIPMVVTFLLAIPLKYNSNHLIRCIVFSSMVSVTVTTLFSKSAMVSGVMANAHILFSAIYFCYLDRFRDNNKKYWIFAALFPFGLWLVLILSVAAILMIF